MRLGTCHELSIVSPVIDYKLYTHSIDFIVYTLPKHLSSRDEVVFYRQRFSHIKQETFVGRDSLAEEGRTLTGKGDITLSFPVE